MLRSLFVISACSCMTAGSKDASCTDSNGDCTCNTGYTGSKCDSCANEYFMDDGKCKGMVSLFRIYSHSLSNVSLSNMLLESTWIHLVTKKLRYGYRYLHNIPLLYLI